MSKIPRKELFPDSDIYALSRHVGEVMDILKERSKENNDNKIAKKKPTQVRLK